MNSYPKREKTRICCRQNITMYEIEILCILRNFNSMLDTKNSALHVDIHSGNCSEQSSKTRGVLLEGSNNKFWSLSLATDEFTLNSNQEPQKDALHLRGLLSECSTMFYISLSLFALKQPRSQNL